MSSLKKGASLQNGKYIISSVLGQGGFGITYEAEQVSLGRKVAVKEFFMKDICNRDEATSYVSVPSIGSKNLVEKFRAKFIKEARMLAGYKHPSIVKVYDVFEENGTAYYVMEYLEGGSLQSLVKSRGKLGETEALRYIRETSEALGYIHSRHTLHLDVKPGNIMLDSDGRAVLIDFGISKHIDSEGHLTSSTPLGVSKGYAPFEQVAQEPDSSYSAATDIYSLGATLYFLVTGKQPFDASAILKGLPTGELEEAGVSRKTIGAISAAMKVQKDDRPQSVEAFLSLLDNIAKEDEDEVTVVPSKPKENPAPKNNSSVVLNRIEKAAPQEKPSGSSPWKKYGVAGGIAILAVLALIIFLPNRKQSIPQDSLLIDGMQECIAEFESGPMEREFKIEKTFEERWTYSGVPEWCTAKASEGKVVLTVSENKTKECRNASIEFKKKDGKDVLANLTVKQKAAGVKFGSAKISSTPSGASIWIDGRDTKKTTPEIIEDLTVGSHKVVLKLSGYEDASGKTSVRENERTELAMTLAKKKEQPSLFAIEAQPSKQEVSNSSTISSSASTSSTTGTHAGHEWVDLGLSVKWATCNVGSSTPEGYGYYFAWGETSQKSEYTWANLKYCNNDTGDSFSKYNQHQGGTKDNKTRLDMSDDAARQNWGGNWRMPTNAEFLELINMCTWTWTAMNGKNGYKVVSKSNGNSIFLPAAGWRYDSSFYGAGTLGSYWSSSLYGSNSYDARGFDFDSGRHITNDIVRRSGRSVRPVFR